MNRIKIASAAIVLAAGTIGAFAFSKANNEEIKKLPQTYWVTELASSTHYKVSMSEPEESQCGFGNLRPCEIETTANVSGDQILISDVNDPLQTTINSKQPEFAQ
ncbi:hypothetical protein NU10_02760 [Flavobacterium dauae]|uniref:hypothetical protein n=1 Tax=Flavobacterium dauae TaxID=1563479 RepID=UPI00101B35EA|nr:hypothetical protein [Flavobacterium dauae]WLD24342.1 hypothetical protein NU10_02760 [Flavobacterium dauae]